MNQDKNLPQRKNIRLREYDYSLGAYYFVTICINEKKSIFGTIKNKKIYLNSIGEIASNEWINTEKIRPNIRLHSFIIMPNHMHGIIEIDYFEIKQKKKSTLGDIIRGYKSSVTRKANLLISYKNRNLWQRNYYEHII